MVRDYYYYYYYYYHVFIIFMQGIYNHIHEPNHVSRVCSVAAVLCLQFLLHVMLLRPRKIVCTFTLALSVVRVQYPMWLFLQFFNFVLSWYVAQVLSVWFWNGSCRPCYCRYHFCFHIPHALNTHYYYYYYYYYYCCCCCCCCKTVLPDVLKFVAETSVKSSLRNSLKDYNVKRSFVRNFVQDSNCKILRLNFQRPFH